MTDKIQQTPQAKPGLPAAPWNPWLGILFIVLLFFLSQLFAGILISVYPYLKHWTFEQGNDWLSTSVSAQFVLTLLIEGIVIGAIVLFAKQYVRGLLSIGVRRPRWKDLLAGIATAPAYYGVYFIVYGLALVLFPKLDVAQKQQIGFTGVHGTTQLIMTFVSLVILPPIAEELMMRGVLFSSLKKLAPLWVAAILTSLLFAVAHLPEGGSDGPLYIAAIDTFVLSLFLVGLRERTRGIWAGMVLHASKNFIAFYYLFIRHVV